ncbi:MAG: hypothetical protein CMC05_10420 [Flavobacteriaceae bacterium]|nr:hypothetical protein [Flavobacteriaceae bacterium]
MIFTFAEASVNVEDFRLTNYDLGFLIWDCRSFILKLLLLREWSKSVVVSCFIMRFLLLQEFGDGGFEFFIDIFFVYPEVLAVGLYTNVMGFG